MEVRSQIIVLVSIIFGKMSMQSGYYRMVLAVMLSVALLVSFLCMLKFVIG